MHFKPELTGSFYFEKSKITFSSSRKSEKTSPYRKWRYGISTCPMLTYQKYMFALAKEKKGLPLVQRFDAE
jgi:hypothetical protein